MKIVRRNDISKLVVGNEDQVLIIGATGHGKTLACERLAEQYFEKGFCVVCLPTPKMNLELGYIGFLPEKQYHLDRLEFQKETPAQHPFKLYHSYCSNLPTNRKIPDFNIFTINIKNLDRFLCYFLFESSSETIALNLLLNTLSTLKNNEGLFDLVRTIKNRVKRVTTKDTFSVEARSGTEKEINRIVQSFQRFRFNPLLQPANFKFNLDMEAVLKDNKHYHIFTNKYVLDPKIRDFITLYVLSELRRCKEQSKSKHPVVVVMEELKSFAPASPIYSFKITLNKILSELISTCRGLEINFLSSSQIYQEISSEVRESFNELALGKTSALRDLFEISKVCSINAETRRAIMGLKQNHFYILSMGEGVDEGSFLIHLPRHMHQERGYVYDKIFEKYYPNRMKKFDEEVKYIKDSWKQQEKGTV